MNQKRLVRALVFAFLFLEMAPVFSQDFMMQGWYWDYPKNGCNGFSGPNWAVTLNSKVSELHTSGFNWIWTPPASRASFGACSNGYDPKDLYDLGEFGLGRTGFGTRAEVNTLISNLNANSMNAVADVVFNHRDGGRAESNPAVKNYIVNYPVISGAAPYPSDRWRAILPIGGSTGRGAGDYYFKIRSKSVGAGFNGYGYVARMNTNVSTPNQTAVNEVEPNGGGDCGEPNNTILLRQNMNATLETTSGCSIDEFHLNLSASQFNSAGDTIFINLNNTGGYSDHYVYGVWYQPTSGGGSDVGSAVDYQTFTNFNSLPSDRGGMNYLNFRPDGTHPTTLTGDEEAMYFFYDYEQAQQTTKDSLNAFAKWLWLSPQFRGFRMDAVKHFPASFVSQLFNYLYTQSPPIKPQMIVGEHFTSDAGVLNSWINAVFAGLLPAAAAELHIRAFDFELRQALKDACDSYGYDARLVFQKGIVDGAGNSGFNVVTFLNNHDYRNAGEPIQNQPMLGYAYILTNNGVGAPCVFYPDYYGIAVPNAPTAVLKTQINNLISLHKTWITGASRDYLSRIGTPYYQYFVPGQGQASTTVTYQLSGGVGGKEVIVAINFSGTPLDYYQGVKLVNGVGPGTTFTDMLGYSGGTTTNITPNNEIHITLPARSYTVYVQGVQSPLPLDWLKINAEFVEHTTAEITWAVANECNSRGFSIEKSTDGGRSFKKIGFEESHGFTHEDEYYHFFDDYCLEKQTWYRVIETDLDGKTHPSQIVYVENPDFEIYFDVEPNLLGDGDDLKLVVTQGYFDVDEKELTSTLVQPDGRVISSFSGSFFEIENALNSTMKNEPRGLYFLHISLSGSNGQTLKIVKN